MLVSGMANQRRPVSHVFRLALLSTFIASCRSAPVRKDLDTLLSGINMDDEAMRHINMYDFLGTWAGNETTRRILNENFVSALPFPHVEIPNFFSDEIADRLLEKFPAPQGQHTEEWEQEGWHVYDNPIEGKLANDNVESMAHRDKVYKVLWEVLQSPQLTALLANMTSIPGLENDPHLHGAGLHYHPRGSRLEMHLDYSIHPVTKKERRVNLIVYMNRGWEEEWGGHLELWEGTLKGLSRAVKKVSPRYNHAVLFRTSDVSWHGMPDPVMCPEGEARKSIAIYYVSEARQEATPRFKAAYRPRPGHIEHERAGYEELCRLRETRRLEEEDMRQHTPDFEFRWRKPRV